MRLLYFSPVPWDSYDQRPHYFARHFLSCGGEAVWWVNPYPARLPRLSDVTRSDRRQPPLRLDRPAGLTVIDIKGLPIDPLPGGARLNSAIFWREALTRLREFVRRRDTVLGIGRPTALASAALRSLDPAWSFYDAMDDFPEFYDGLSRRSTARVEAAISVRVGRIYASSRHLVDKFASGPAPVIHLPNAFDMALLPPVSAPSPAASALGFVGCMGRWFDWSLVATLAEAVAPRPVVLVGPRPTDASRPLPSNIEQHPACSQREAVLWLRSFRVGLIPFVRTRLTAGIDPIKFYQYRAAGLPVLTTRFGEMARHTDENGVFYLDDPAGTATVVTEALAYRASEAEITRFREAHTWTRRFEAANIMGATTT